MERARIVTFLRYASGEIAIVIIGILFVLFANFIVEEIQEDKDELLALEGLKDDILKDHSELTQFWIPRLESQDIAREKLSSYIENPWEIMDSAEFAADLMLVTTYFTFNQNKAAIEELINGGQLNLVENSALRKSVLNYKAKNENIAEFDIIHRGYFLEIQGEIARKLFNDVSFPEIFKCYHLGDTVTLKTVSSRALNISDNHQLEALRWLLSATGTPYIIKRTNYLDLRTQSATLLEQLENEIASRE